MEFVCRRCGRVTKQKPYRVRTEDGGLVLLNMLVCTSCARLARRLGLPAIRMESSKKATSTNGVKAMTGSKQQRVQTPPSIR
jgi:ribosome-binding protein aMBF1 (putative translation factor)